MPQAMRSNATAYGRVKSEAADSCDGSLGRCTSAGRRPFLLLKQSSCGAGGINPAFSLVLDPVPYR
eukprot:1501428-Amphidinium_carterae.1